MRTHIHCTIRIAWYDSLFRQGRSLEHTISYAAKYIWYHSCKPNEIICLWHHMLELLHQIDEPMISCVWLHFDFIPYIICLWYHMLELRHHIYELMISYIWLHTLYHTSMIAFVGTIILCNNMISCIWCLILYHMHMISSVDTYDITYLIS